MGEEGERDCSEESDLANDLPSTDVTLHATPGPTCTGEGMRLHGVTGHVTHIILSKVSKSLPVSPLDLLHGVGLGDGH